MEKFYTIFIASDELFTCPTVTIYGHRHDYMLTLGSPGEIRITLPTNMTTVTDNMHLIYNPHMLDIFYAHVTVANPTAKTAAYLYLKVTPKELGSTNLGIAINNQGIVPSYNLDSLLLGLDTDTQFA